MGGQPHAELMPEGLAALLSRAASGEMKARPVEAWNPPDCGPIDIRIDRDGRWYHLGSPIGREPLVRLFASILRREPDGSHVLVTPVEKLSITVDDVAFLAVEMHAEGRGSKQRLTFRTNVGDVVTAGPDHPLRFAVDPANDGVRPYVRVRGGLEARLTRPLLYDLVALSSESGGRVGVMSDGAFFELPPMEMPA